MTNQRFDAGNNKRIDGSLNENSHLLAKVKEEV